MLSRRWARHSAIWVTLAVISGSGVHQAYAECRFKGMQSDDAVTYRFSSEESSSGRRFLITMTFRV